MRERMRERKRMREKDSIDIIDAREKKLGELTVEYLRGELSLEDYHQGCRKNENRIDFRRLAAQQIRSERERKIENAKRKVKNFTRKILRFPQNS
jgi:hypothetical protein